MFVESLAKLVITHKKNLEHTRTAKIFLNADVFRGRHVLRQPELRQTPRETKIRREGIL